MGLCVWCGSEWWFVMMEVGDVKGVRREVWGFEVCVCGVVVGG